MHGRTLASPSRFWGAVLTKRHRFLALRRTCFVIDPGSCPSGAFDSHDSDVKCRLQGLETRLFIDFHT